MDTRPKTVELRKIEKRDQPVVFEQRALGIKQGFRFRGVECGGAVEGAHKTKYPGQFSSGVRGLERPSNQSQAAARAAGGLNGDAGIASVQGNAVGHRSGKRVVGRVGQVNRGQTQLRY